MSCAVALSWFGYGLAPAYGLDTPDESLAAQRELFADHFENAVTLYSKLLADRPSETDAWYGLVRAELGLHHSEKAYAAAEQAIAKAPQSAGAQTAAGLANFRRGDLGAAEKSFRAALKIDPNYAGALRGMGAVFSAVSMYKSARDVREKAYRQSPEDPDLILSHANTLKGAEHIALLEAALARVDPASNQARRLRVHIANDKAVGDRKIRRLVSPYESSEIKLSQILDGPSRLRGVGLTVVLNQKQSVNLLLDTGASGILVSPKLAEKAGLQILSSESSEASGIGDAKAQESFAYLAPEVRIGGVVFADYPVAVFRSAKSADFDGIIGADVFQQFLVKIDFVKMVLSLEPRPSVSAEGSDESSSQIKDAPAPAPGFFRVLRFGNHLAVPTTINDSTRRSLFLLDSGSSSNLIDMDAAREFTHVDDNPRVIVKGVQGKVEKTALAARISLVFAGLRQNNTDLIAISLEKLSDGMGAAFGGILGMPVLRNLAVTIDYLGGTIKLEYKKP